MSRLDTMTDKMIDARLEMIEHYRWLIQRIQDGKGTEGDVKRIKTAFGLDPSLERIPEGLAAGIAWTLYVLELEK